MSATDTTPQEQRALKDIIRSVRAGKPTRAKLDELEKRKRRRTETTDEAAATNTASAPESADSLAKPTAPQNEMHSKQQESTEQTSIHEKESQPVIEATQPMEQESDEIILGTVDDSDDEVPVNSHQNHQPTSSKGGSQAVASQAMDQKKNEKLAAEKNPQTQTPSKQLLDLTAPQVQFINGKIVIDQSSLVITAEPEVTPIEEYNVVREGSAYLTSFTYSNRSMTERWSEAETTKFYQHLREFGTDFSMMVRLFPNRTRNQLKNKYKREDRENPRLITAALSSRLNTQELLALVSSTIGNPSANQPTTSNITEERPQTQGQESIQPPLLLATKPDSVQPTHESVALHTFSEHEINTVAESTHANALFVSELNEPPSLITDGEDESHPGDEDITPLDVLQQAASVAAKELEQQSVVPPIAESVDPFPLEPTTEPENLLTGTCQSQEEINPGSLSPAESLY